MFQICGENKCTGCGLCAAVCTKNAIEISIRGLHYFPTISQDKCINCGMCVKKCIVNSPIDLYPSNECYAAWSKDEIEHYECTSAGLATILARHFIQYGGVVVGCAWDRDLRASAIITDKLEDLDRLKKSKYVHSYFPADVYHSVLDKLKEGKRVLFIGVPCQGAALKQYVGKMKSHLYICDLLCHGGSSPKLLNSYVKKCENRFGKVSDITFRGGKYDCYFCLWDKDKNLLYKGEQFSDPYFYTFMRHTALRPSCYQCQYAHGERPGDLTLADFWGLDEKFIDEHGLSMGVNVVIPHTQKGNLIFSEIRSYIECYKRDIKEAVAGNDTLREPTPYPQGYRVMSWAYPIFGLRTSLALFDIKYQLAYLKRGIRFMIPDSIKRSIKKLIMMLIK